MDYDLVFYVNTANGPLGLLTKVFGTKSAIITDGLEWNRPKWAGLGAKYFLWASKKATEYIDVLISDSVEMKKIYQDKFGVDSEVIAYGANPINRNNSKTTENFERFCQQNNLDKEGYYLIVGRLVPDNNADLLIEGFHQSNSDRKLIVVGDVPYQDEWADRVKGFASDQIIFTGYIRNQEYLTDLFINSYVYLHGHEHGGTNPSLLTALAKKCAVLALDTRFSREVLDDGEFGFYFDKNLESISESINYLDKNKEEVNALKNRAQDRIYEAYTWQKIADQYEKLFKRIENK
jgi:glycosyltransferase involved in cell wall biosynthesis